MDFLYHRPHLVRLEDFPDMLVKKAPQPCYRGEFVGTVADNPDCKIELKTFHCQIQNNAGLLKAEENNYKNIPSIRKVTEQQIQDNYMQVKLDVQLIIQREMETLRSLKKKEIK